MCDVKELVDRFNQGPNDRDVEWRSGPMTSGHLFVDSAGEPNQGRDTMSKIWEGFFRGFPDCQNQFANIEGRRMFAANLYLSGQVIRNTRLTRLVSDRLPVWGV